MNNPKAKDYDMPQQYDTKKRFLSFDATINSGHIITALTIVFCSVGAWYDVKGAVAIVKEENIRQDSRIEETYKEQKLELKEVQENVIASNALQRNEMNKLRDDMNNWFIRLDDKLDSKKDK